MLIENTVRRMVLHAECAFHHFKLLATLSMMGPNPAPFGEGFLRTGSWITWRRNDQTTIINELDAERIDRLLSSRLRQLTGCRCLNEELDRAQMLAPKRCRMMSSP